MHLEQNKNFTYRRPKISTTIKKIRLLFYQRVVYFRFIKWRKYMHLQWWRMEAQGKKTEYV